MSYDDHPTGRMARSRQCHTRLSAGTPKLREDQRVALIRAKARRTVAVHVPRGEVAETLAMLGLLDNV